MISVQYVIEHTYKPVELILIDDDSSEILDERIIEQNSAIDFKIKIIRNKKNLGPGFSIEAGRLIAKVITLHIWILMTFGRKISWKN